MAGTFKLRCSVVGHEKDVRALAPAHFPVGAIVSGSRDVTARVWVPNEFNAAFTEGHIMSGHTRFVSSVCCMPPSDKYPQGVIVTGSNDSTILGFTLDSPQPVFKMEGHTDNVCALACGKFGTLLSGSWDTTAKVWVGEKNVMTLKGHTFAVWAVALMPENGLMLSASADKTIKMWKAGNLENTFSGHTDCVRGLAVLNKTEFLSCSNDSTIRRWLISGECTHTYYGHTNFVYCIAVMPGNSGDFVTAGEDRTLRIWNNGECQQTISHPTQSVWTVCCLDNGDIATGASDAVIRVFTRSPERMAGEEEQKEFDDQVAASEIPKQVGDINTQDLPGPEALLRPGKKEGQTLMVRNMSKVECHQWNMAEKKWVKIGDIVGSSGGSQATSGKMLHDGKEYDFVFDIDVEEGKPPLKLPYNLSEDPWFAAQTFIHKNNLSQNFLDQIANFITENTKGATLSQAPAAGYNDPFTGGNRYEPGAGQEFPTDTSSNVSDPFTGGGRYVPGAGAAFPSGSGGGSDPLTGGGRYVPGSGQSFPSNNTPGSDPLTGGGRYVPEGVAAMETETINSYYPKTTYLSFEACNAAALLGKVKEFNAIVDSSLRIEESGFEQLKSMLESDKHTEEQLILLDKMLQWPEAHVFPALDILRIAIKSKATCDRFCTANDKSFLKYLSRFLIADANTANQMLVLRTLCNMFGQDSGCRLILENRDDVLTTALLCKDVKNKNVQIAIATLLLNYAVSCGPNTQDDAPKSPCLSAVSVMVQNELDMEASFRLLVCIGTLIQNDDISVAVASSLNIDGFIAKMKTIKNPAKVGECATFVANALGC